MTLQDEVTTSIKPGDDFYNYVNKKWLDSHPIPSDKSRYGGFTVLDENTVEQLKTLVEQPSDSSEPVNIKLVKTFYRSAMDETAIEQAGTSPLQPITKAIESTNDVQALQVFISNWHARGLPMVWQIDIDVDDKDSSHYITRITQEGLGLPNRDYYLEPGERFKNIRDHYLTFLTSLFTLLGKSNPAKRAKNVFAIELALAKVSNTAIQERDDEAKYNVYSIKELEQKFTGFNWQQYLKQVGVNGVTRLQIAQPKFLGKALELMASQPAKDWQDYLQVHSVLPLMRRLPKAFVDLDFSFYGKVLGGTEVLEPRYKRIIKVTVSNLPDPIGQLYVEHHFDESAKQKIKDLVKHVQGALRQRIEKLDWMSDATKQKAFEKLDTFTPLLGYPDTWRSYKNLTFTNSYVDNYLALQQCNWQYDVERLNRPVDRSEWLMSPAMVNAYYWPNTNGITFPAAILQPPFFDATGDFAANYGGIGEVIGHEIIHGFDDQGSNFDASGNMNSWWTTEDRKAFEARAKQLEEQFDAYEIDGKHVKGALTLGENIADLGGILIAYDAMQEKLAETGNRDLVNGFTPEQRFFMSQARCWRQNIRPELALQFLVTDPHSPTHLRVNGVVTNVDAFYDAFNVKEGDALYKPADQRVRIW